MLYLINLWGTYIYDDAYIAQLDPRLHHVRRWGEFLTRGYFPGAPDRLWRPLTNYTFALEWLAHGDRPWVMHLVNLMLYALVCGGVAHLAGLLGGRRVAWIGGLLFAAHPVHVEVVAYLVGRADLLCTLFMVCGVCLFLRGRMDGRRVVTIWLLMVLGLLSKEPAMLLPPLLLIFLPVRRRVCPPAIEGSKPEAMSLLTLFLSWTLAGYIVFREESKVFKFSWDPIFLDRTMNPLPSAGGVDRLLLPFSLVGRYLQILVCPWRLSIDYSGWIPSRFTVGDPFFYLGVAAVAGWWVAFIYFLRRKNWVVVSLLGGFVLTYAMVANFGILIGALFGERLIFLPSVFFIILVAMGVARWSNRVVAPLIAVVMVLFVLRGETYAWRWNDATRLYSMCSEEQPGSVRLCMLMMDRYRDLGDYEAAARAGERGRAARPEYWRIWYYSALVEAERGRYEAAIALINHGMAMPHTDPGELAGLRAQIQGGTFVAEPPSGTKGR
jgi:hypothetical protein